ncbi:MAG: MauE/DoxX family redox-associated membrane protein [Tepidisphaerales bacterium]
MQKIYGWKLAVICVNLVVGSHFVVAGFAKVAATDDVVVATILTDLISTVQHRRYVGAVEVFLGLWLWSQLAGSVARLCATLALSSFALVLFLEQFRDDPRSCGCGGTSVALLNEAEVRFSLAIRTGQNILLVVAMIAAEAVSLVRRDLYRQAR